VVGDHTGIPGAVVLPFLLILVMRYIQSLSGNSSRELQSSDRVAESCKNEMKGMLLPHLELAGCVKG
jgi:hypothetical protein